MNYPVGEVSGVVFRRANRQDLQEFSLDSQMLTVLMQLDGKKSSDVIAEDLGLDMGTMTEITARLLHVQLIEPVQDTISMLDGNFFDFLHNQLSLAIGPIAGVLIEEGLNDLGLDVHRFPKHRAAELVDLLAREIHRDEKRDLFKQSMITKIRETG
jgi:hypothetical protein